MGDLAVDLKPTYVKYIFSRCGNVLSVHLLKDKDRGFINFSSADACARAIQLLNGFTLENKKIWVDYPDKGEDNIEKEMVMHYSLVPIKIDSLPPQVPKQVIKMLCSRYV